MAGGAWVSGSPARVGYAYCITNLVNGKRYIGVTRRPTERWTAHRARSKSIEARMLHRAMRKYGIDNFTFEPIACADGSSELLFALEQTLIEQYGTFDRHAGYNRSKGGAGPSGMEHSRETRARMSRTRKGKPHSESHSLAMRGKAIHPNAEAALRAANIGRPKSPEHHSKLRAANLGRPLSEEHRRKLSEAGKKYGHRLAEYVRTHLAGKSLSEEHRQKLRIVQSGRCPSGVCIAAAAEANRGRKRDPALVERVASANRGRKRSPETKARIAAAQRLRHASSARQQAITT